MMVMFEKSGSSDKIYINRDHVLYLRAWLHPETTLITLATVSPSISYEFSVKGDVETTVKKLNSAV
jgi:hypothetical protein